MGPNPAQGGQSFADGINIHCGNSQTNRGSAGCITIDPAHCQEVWDVLESGKTGTVQVARDIGGDVFGIAEIIDICGSDVRCQGTFMEYNTQYGHK
jgi:hypothetical protein